MKRTFYIFTLILFALMPFTSNAQTEFDDELTLWIVKNDCVTGADTRDLVENQGYKILLTGECNIKRLNDRELLLTSKSNPNKPLKIASDKGYIYFEGEDDNYKNPIHPITWQVGGLDKLEEQINIKIYNYKTNEILGEKNYSLNAFTYEGVEAQPGANYVSKIMIVGPKECYTSGDFYSIFDPSKNKAYDEKSVNDIFKNTSIQRIDDKTLYLRTRKKPSSIYRVVADRGVLKFRVESSNAHWKRARKFSVSKLTTDDKDLTVRVYDNNTNQLLGSKTYQLKPVPEHIYGGKLQLTDTTGLIRILDDFNTSLDDLRKIPVDYNKPIRIIYDSSLEDKCKVVSYEIKRWGMMDNIMATTYNSDTLAPNVFEDLLKRDNISITFKFTIEQDGEKRKNDPNFGRYSHVGESYWDILWYDNKEKEYF